MPPLDTFIAAPLDSPPVAETGERAAVAPANAFPTTETQASEASESTRRPAPFGIQKRVKEWIRTLHRDPSEEARANAERRARLLDEINRAVVEAPDDIPIKDLVAQLNRHNDD